VSECVGAGIAAVDAPTTPTSDFPQDARGDASFDQVVGGREGDAQSSLDITDIGDGGTHQVHDEFAWMAWSPHGIGAIEQFRSYTIEGSELADRAITRPGDRAPDLCRPCRDRALGGEFVTAPTVEIGIEYRMQVQGRGCHAHAHAQPGCACRPREFAVAIRKRCR
jgi:hypothetical protein